MDANFLLRKNIIPDIAIRLRIRWLLKKRLRDESKSSPEEQQEHLNQLIAALINSPIAIHVEDANKQHYEIPAEFFQYCLGKHLKYSCGYWASGVRDLDESEKQMLELTCQRAELADGQAVLELGCGWGSLSLFMAEQYPKSRFTGVSNSASQKKYIEGQIAQRGLSNLSIVTADMNDFSIEGEFDRVVSVEMFEHMRNYQKLMKKIAGFLKPGGKLFVHIFTHYQFTYTFEIKDETDWMTRYFFSGGIMPADSLLFYFDEDIPVERHWQVSGLHYSKTCESWLQRLDKHKKDILSLFEKTYGPQEALKWWVYWRIFFMSCSELWKFRGGKEWMVSHYLFKKK